MTVDIGNLIIVVSSGLALVTGGGGLVGGVMWRFRRLGAAERDQIAAAAAKNAVGALNVALDRYVTDLKNALVRVEDLEIKLREANENIARLQDELHSAHGDRMRLQEELRHSMDTRARLEEELGRQHTKITELEQRLEAATGSR